MENSQDVLLDSSPAVETVTPEVRETIVEEIVSDPSKPPKGYVPYQALAEERTKRQELEQEVAELKTSLTPEDGVEISEVVK